MTAVVGPVPLVLLPGLGGRAEEMAPLARAWRYGPTLCLDPVVDGDLSMSAQADRLVAAVRAAGLDRVAVAGHSQGGLVALELASREDPAVVAVALLDSPVLLPAPVRAVGRLVAALVRTPLGPAVLRAFTRATFTEADTAAFRAGVMAGLNDVPRAAAGRIVAAAFGYDSARALRSVRVPLAVARANVPIRLDALPAHARGAEILGGGHWVHVHRTDEVASLLDDLAARIAAEGAR